MTKLSPLLALSIAAICLSSCDKTEPKAEGESHTVLRLPITRVSREPLAVLLNLPGIVFALPDKSVKVSPGIAGKLIDVKVSPGDHVERGQTIAILDSRQLRDQMNQARAKVLVAKAGVEQAKTNLMLAQNVQERNVRLVQQDVGAQKDLVAATSQVETARAQVTAAQAQVADANAGEEAVKAQLSYTTLKSPITGLVAQRYLNISDSDDPATPVVQIVDLSQVIVEAALPTTQPVKVNPGAGVQITAQALPGQAIAGTVQSINPVTDNQGTTIGVRIICNNPDYDLKEGMPVTAAIHTGQHPNALTVPAGALVSDPDEPGTKMVYVFKDGKITRAKVRIGMQIGDSVEILSGLHDGESIVAAGAYGVPDGTEVEPESGANHSTTAVTSKSN